MDKKIDIKRSKPFSNKDTLMYLQGHSVHDYFFSDLGGML